ncbi:helix-turn-helix domain-containing protein [Paenibacillus sp. FSL K6-2524]|uniref:helix-turn-helix domain-containing protein n=1 Tax=Paenibacillus sp. FSL K6-2524 TaxID=2954516 RepID=UPI0030F9FC78
MTRSKKREFFSDCRKEKGERKQVATDLDISIVYLRMIENGTFKPGRDLMIRMSQYFDRPLELLFPDVFDSKWSI